MFLFFASYFSLAYSFLIFSFDQVYKSMVYSISNLISTAKERKGSFASCRCTNNFFSKKAEFQYILEIDTKYVYIYITTYLVCAPQIFVFLIFDFSLSSFSFFATYCAMLITIKLVLPLSIKFLNFSIIYIYIYKYMYKHF